jgi:hypothetical protein
VLIDTASVWQPWTTSLTCLTLYRQIHLAAPLYVTAVGGNLGRGHIILTSCELMWYYARSWDVRGGLTLNSMTRFHSSVTRLTSRGALVGSRASTPLFSVVAHIFQADSGWNILALLGNGQQKPAWNLPMPNVQYKTRDDGQRRCPKHIEFYNRINLDN